MVDARKNPLDGLEIGPKLAACTEKERIFAYALATNLASTATEAAKLAGYGGKSQKALNVTAHHLQHRERVVEAIEEICRTHFRGLIPHAIAAARALILDRDHPDHQKMVSTMLSRLGYGERTGVDVNVSGEITVDHTTRAVEDLRIMKSFGLSREKLVESFGEVGLANYEKILAERAPKLIDHVDPTPTGAVEPAPDLMNDTLGEAGE